MRNHITDFVITIIIIILLIRFVDETLASPLFGHRRPMLYYRLQPQDERALEDWNARGGCCRTDRRLPDGSPRGSQRQRGLKGTGEPAGKAARRPARVCFIYNVVVQLWLLVFYRLMADRGWLFCSTREVQRDFLIKKNDAIRIDDAQSSADLR